MATKPTSIVEFVDNRGVTLRVDQATGIVRGVKVLGFKSANGRVYRESAVSRAIRMYEGAKVNVDHPEGANDKPRSYGDRFGHLRAIRQESDGLYGDLHFNPKHRLAEQFAWDAEHAAENVGLSHNVMARTSKENGQVVVEEILKVNSVDLVADPATTRGLFEHQEQNMEITLESVRAEAKIVEALKAEWLAEQKASGESKQLADEVATLKTQLAESKKKLDEAETREKLAAKKALAAKLITEAKLPADAVSDLFREHVEAAADEAAMKALIEDRAKLVTSSTKVRPQSKAQQVAESKGDGLQGIDTIDSAIALLRG